MKAELGVRRIGIWLGTITAVLACNNAPNQSAAATPSGGQPSAPAPQPAAPPSAAQPPATAPAAGGPSPSASSVAGLASLPVGSSVDVTAKFFGWKGPCRGAPPTRSAWQLADDAAPGSACVYVDGPMPAGLNPAGDRGMSVRVRGTLETDGNTTNIRAQSSEVVPP
ncbi:MAG: hypothetical protein JW940_07520 [Polyangiaceae bacterium]|nr:hypothetical protein [Polyangiaceae bacterium]